VKSLSRHGFETVRYRHRIEQHGYLAGSDASRAAELNEALSGEGLPDALICVRGGYGSLRILDRIDYAAARRRPRLLVGYSDITALQLALLRKCGWASISGPMVAVDWKHPDEASIDQFLRLASGRHGETLSGPNGEPLTPVTTGSAGGILIGGNLTLLSRLAGTPYLPDLTDAILFLEEVGEPPYRVDGYLAQLRLAGLLDRVAGVVLGGFTEASPTPGRPSLDMDRVFEDYFGGLGIPVARNLAYGHFPVKSAIPIGVRAHLEVSSDVATLTLLEQVVDV
jgi:muramoyltetrapeptide carboxypeptidase